MRQGKIEKRHFYAEDARRSLEKAQASGRSDQKIQRLWATLYNYQGVLADDWRDRVRFYAKADALLVIVSRNDPEAFLLRSQCLMERADSETDLGRRKAWLDQAEAALKTDVIQAPLLEKARLAALRGDSYGFVRVFLQEAAQSNNNPADILALIRSAVSQDESAPPIMNAPLSEAFIALERAAVIDDWNGQTAAMIKASEALDRIGDDNGRLPALLKMRLAALQRAPNAFIATLKELMRKKRGRDEALASVLSMRNYLTRNDEEIKIWESSAMRVFLVGEK